MGMNATKSPYFRLLRAHLNEGIAPDILPFQKNLITEIKDWVAKMKFKSKPENLSLYSQLITGWYQQELKRINFLMCSYHRNRLRKIQKYAHHYYILMAEGVEELLSVIERRFIESYTRIWEAFMTPIISKIFPPNFR